MLLLTDKKKIYVTFLDSPEVNKHLPKGENCSAHNKVSEAQVEDWTNNNGSDGASSVSCEQLARAELRSSNYSNPNLHLKSNDSFANALRCHSVRYFWSPLGTNCP